MVIKKNAKIYTIDEKGELISKKTTQKDAKTPSTLYTVSKAFEIVNTAAPILILTYIGFYFEHTRNIRNSTLIGIIIGLVFSFYNLYLITKNGTTTHKHKS
ncbi:AtpZ/AtpI family protein [Candidatus Woesebacteria bacterium]|nr:AtpZ/AtpI family protein [Candidatus Woesebacteria bacterium]